MGNLLLFAQNILEASDPLVSTPTTTQALLERLRDRERTARWQGVSTAQHDILVVTSATALEATHLALINHNLLFYTIEVSGSNTGSFGGPFETAMVNADPFLLPFAAWQNWKFYNLRIPAGAVIPAIGEILLGTPSTVKAPTAKLSRYTTVGNVRQDQSRGGVIWGVRRGPSRHRIDAVWAGLENAGIASVLAAYAAAADGAKKLLVRDALGVLRWMAIMDEELPRDVLSGRAQTARLTLLEDAP